jgi:hypothetical protein
MRIRKGDQQDEWEGKKAIKIFKYKRNLFVKNIELNVENLF